MRGRRSRWTWAVLSVGAWGFAAGLVACGDLFHSTSGGTCGDGGCVDATPAADARRVDAGADAAKDATKDSAKDGAKDVLVADVTVVHDGGHRDGTTEDAHDAEVDHKAPFDAGHDAATDFCSWSPAEAQARAKYACMWIGACEGISLFDDVGWFGDCYSAAIVAYDCAANPGMRVTGPLHAYWDALWQAKTCAEVTAATFPHGTPTCSGGSSQGCSAADPDVAFVCAGEGTATGVSCAIGGYTCVDGGTCGLPGGSACVASSDAGPHTSCSGTVLHVCDSKGDQGQDCRSFGAGACAQLDGSAGCVPADAGHAGDAGAPCKVTPFVECGSSGRYVVGCPTGALQTFDCAALGDGGRCANEGFIGGPSLYGAACAVSGGPDDIIACQDAGLSGFFAAIGGTVGGDCTDAGLGPCAQASTHGSITVSCGPPP